MGAEFDAGAVVGRMVLMHQEMGKAIAAIKKDFTKLEKSQKKDVKKMGDSWTGLKKIIRDLGIAYVAKQVYDFANECVRQFAKVEQSVDANNRLLKKYGTNWETLKKQMKDAMGGVADELTMLEQAGTGLLLGIKPDEIVKMSEIARAAARAMGKDVTYMLESIITGTARQSRLWLDNLGIIIDVEQAYKDYAKTLDKDVKALTDMEKRQAFTNAVLKKGEDIIKRVGVAGKTMAERIQTAEANSKDLKTAIGNLLTKTPVLKDAVDGLARTFGFWADQINRAAKALNRIEITAKEKELKELLKRREEIEAGKPVKYKTKVTSSAFAPMMPLGAGIENQEMSPSQMPAEYGEVNARITELQMDIKAAKKDLADIEAGSQPESTETSTGGGGGKEKSDYDLAMEKMQWLHENTATEEQLLLEQKEKVLEILRAGIKDKEQLKQAELDVEDYYNGELKRINDEKTEADRQAAADKLQWLHDQNASQEQLLYEEKEKTLSILRAGITDKERLKEAELLVEKYYNDQSAKAAKKAAEARKKEIDTLMQAGKVGVDLFVGNQQKAAKIKGLIEIAEATRAGAEFIGTMNPQKLLESLQHGLAAKQYFEAARAGGGSGGGSSGGGGGGGGAAAQASDLKTPDEEDYKKTTTVEMNIHNHGAVLDGDKLETWAVNELAPVVDNAIGQGRMVLNTGGA